MPSPVVAADDVGSKQKIQQAKNTTSKKMKRVEQKKATFLQYGIEENTAIKLIDLGYSVSKIQTSTKKVDLIRPYLQKNIIFPRKNQKSR